MADFNEGGNGIVFKKNSSVLFVTDSYELKFFEVDARGDVIKSGLLDSDTQTIECIAKNGNDTFILTSVIVDSHSIPTVYKLSQSSSIVSKKSFPQLKSFFAEKALIYNAKIIVVGAKYFSDGQSSNPRDYIVQLSENNEIITEKNILPLGQFKNSECIDLILLDSRIFALVKSEHDLYLVCMDPDSLQLIWSEFLYKTNGVNKLLVGRNGNLVIYGSKLIPATKNTKWTYYPYVIEIKV